MMLKSRFRKYINLVSIFNSLFNAIYGRNSQLIDKRAIETVTTKTIDVKREQQLKQFSRFLQHHQNVVNDLMFKNPIITPEEINDTRNCPILTNVTKDSLHSKLGSSIGINFSHENETISTIELIQSDNKCLNKTIVVFVQLCTEVRELCNEGKPLLIKCLLANEEIFEHVQKSSDNNLANYSKSSSFEKVKHSEGNDCDKIDENSLSADIIAKINSLLGTLFHTQLFIERCFNVISQIIKQFSALFDVNTSGYINVDHSSLHFQSVFSRCSELIVLIIKFDTIFQDSQLTNIWPQYMNAIKMTEPRTEKNYTLHDVDGLQNVLLKIKSYISGHIFQKLIDSLKSQKTQSKISTQAFSQFSHQFFSYLRNTLSLVQKNINISSTNPSRQISIHSNLHIHNSDDASSDALLNTIDEIMLDPSNLIVKTNAMSIIYHHLFGNLDQHFFSNVIETNTKCPCVLLMENLIWSPEVFLNTFGSTLLMKIRNGNEKMSFSNIQRIQQQFLQIKCQRLLKDLSIHITQVAAWVMSCRNEFNYYTRTKNSNSSSTHPSSIKIADLNRKIFLILQGIEFMEKLNNITNTITNLHVHIKCAMTKQVILSVCKLIELVELIKLTMKIYSDEIFNVTTYLSQYQLYQALQIITNVKTNFQSASSLNSLVYDERTVDILSALELSKLALVGSPNIKRILVARLALTMADPKQVFHSDQLNKICRLFVSMEHLIQFSHILQSLSSETYLYWHHATILPIYLRHIVDVNEAADCEKMQSLFESFADSYYHLKANLNNINFRCPEKLLKDTRMILSECLIVKLCGLIETRLRLDVHASLHLLKVDNDDPFDESSNRINNITDSNIFRILAFKLFPLLEMQPAEPIPTKYYLSIRDYVSKYLSQMSYNLTTITMHDWRTYGHMRILAKQKFHLESTEDHLPTQTLEQGLDVLEIMRNIHLFVSNYSYNLNNQIFVEKDSKNKHLNSINIRHIANSLRTHGIGIINTTVNFTYQFLHKKFYTFSQFLHNEHIQSRLMKDLKKFRETNSNQSEDQHIYCYERANSFNKEIRQLGISKNGYSSLDLFRHLITHIGNAMGYIRMMRSGGIHCCSNASVYLAIDNKRLDFHQNNQLSNVTQISSRNLENEIRHLNQNYAESTEYFKLLVEAFSSFFRNDKNPHIKLFYLIVPALILNYIEYIVAAKHNMNKKAKELITCFTDDGFAMGLAYVLRVLDQNVDFNSLHWFKAVRQKFSLELAQLAKAREENGVNNNASNNSYDTKLQQTLALSERRINTIQHEFDLLYCSLNSAKIFFQ